MDLLRRYASVGQVALEGGEVDLVISGMTITAARSRKVSFVGPYVISGKSILTNSKALAAAREAGEINRADLKLAALAGSTSEEFIQKVAPEATLMSWRGMEGGVEAEAALAAAADASEISDDDAPVIRLVDSIIREAVRIKASDIHVEPLAERLRAGGPQGAPVCSL